MKQLLTSKRLTVFTHSFRRSDVNKFSILLTVILINIWLIKNNLGSMNRNQNINQQILRLNDMSALLSMTSQHEFIQIAQTPIPRVNFKIIVRIVVIIFIKDEPVRKIWMFDEILKCQSERSPLVLPIPLIQFWTCSEEVIKESQSEFCVSPLSTTHLSSKLRYDYNKLIIKEFMETLGKNSINLLTKYFKTN